MNKLSQNLAALFLGIVVVAVVIGAIALELNDSTTPDLLQVIGGAAVGALATLATSSSPA